MHKRLVDYLNDDDLKLLEKVKDCAEKILRKPVDLAYTDHTIEHKKIVHSHLDSFLGLWLEEQQRTVSPEQLRVEVFVLLSATYLHDIGMQMLHPDILAHFPSLSGEDRREAKELSTFEVTEKHRAFARRHHHKIAYDWITGSQGDIQGLPRLEGLDGKRKMVACVAMGHNIWLTDRNPYQQFRKAIGPQLEPEGLIRLDLLAAFLRLADILDQDKRRVDMEAVKRLPLPPVSKVHWWRHHYINACRLDSNIDHAFPLRVSFRISRKHESEMEWLLPALYSATVKEIEAETSRLSRWLGQSGIHVVIPEYQECLEGFDFDPDAEPMPDDVLEAFARTWPQAEGAASRARLQVAAEEGRLTGEAVKEAYSSLAAAIEIEEYVGNVRNQLLGEFRDYPYSPLELRIDRQPGMKSALEQLEAQLQARQARPHPIVLVGDPGGGKTMLLRRYVWEWTEGKREQGILPVYIQSTRFGDPEWAADVDIRLGTQESPDSDRELLATIVVEARKRFEALLAQTLCELAGLSLEHEEAMREALLDILARASVAVFFDGINELPPTLRNLGTWAIQDFVRRYGFQHRVVVTSRTGDFRPVDFPDHLYCELQPMTVDAVRAYWAGVGVSAKAIRRFFDNPLPGILELVQSPMAAYMSGELLKLSDGEPITNQGRLFQRYVSETLKRWCVRWPDTLLSTEHTHDLLSEIAFDALDSLQVSFPPSLVIKVTNRWLEQLDDKEKAALTDYADIDVLSADRVFKELLKTGLLYEVGAKDNKSLRFRHHTLQDYFAAVAIPRRWEQLPTIVAKPVFHEAVIMVAGVVEDPAGFLDRLVHATSDEFGIISMLPLLYSVVGASTVEIPRETLSLLFSAASPLYAAALEVMSPYAVEVLSYLFAQTSWQIFARFLAFIANSPSWSEGVRESVRSDLVEVLNQDGRPTAAALHRFFGRRIPAELWQDHEAAKRAMTAILRDGDHATSLERVPLLLAGFSASLALSVGAKLRVAHALSHISPNQLGQLQAVFISEICTFGSIAHLSPWKRGDTHRLLVDSYAELLLQEEDNCYESRDLSFVQRYLDARTRMGCMVSVAERLVLRSSDIPDHEMPAVLECLRKITVPTGLVLPSRWGGGNGHPIRPEIAALLREHLESSNDPFLVYWLCTLLSESFSTSMQQRLTPSLIAAGAAGYSLMVAHNQHGSIPDTLKRYDTMIDDASLVTAMDQIKKGNLDSLRNVVAEFGLTSQSFSFLLDKMEKNVEQMAGFAQAVNSLDKEAGRTAKLIVLMQLAQVGPPDAVDAMITELGVSPGILFDWCNSFSSTDSDHLIQHLAKRNKVPQYPHNPRMPYFKWLHYAGDYEKLFEKGIQLLKTADQFNPTNKEQIFPLIVRSARALHSSDDPNPRLNDLLEVMPTSLKNNWPTDGWVEMIRSAVKNTELSTDTVTTALVSVLNGPVPKLNLRDRRVLMDLLQKINERAVADCMADYLSLGPAVGEAAGNYIGSGGWYCYLAGDVKRFYSLTEESLTFCPKADWLLGNRAFALYLGGQSWPQVFEAYRRALTATPTRERWQKVAVEDLEKHVERWPHATQISAEVIAEVTALGNTLPSECEALGLPRDQESL